MPACANDGNYSLCGKRKFPRVKCGDCDHQSYLPASDEVIREHLQGKQTIGVYPLLPDDTCRFLAVDFDKTTWQEDVAAFRQTDKGKTAEKDQSGICPKDFRRYERNSLGIVEQDQTTGRFPESGILQETEDAPLHYVDGSVPMLAKMHEKRMKGFKSMGYEQREL